MKKHFISLILITCLCNYGFAQPNIVWQKCFGGSGDDTRPKMEKTNDGGYIIAGDTWSNNGDIVNYHGWCDILIIKIDSLGNKKWSKTYGGSELERALSIKETHDKGYIICGESQSNNGDVSGHHGSTGYGNSDFWIIKIDSAGSIMWQKSLGGTNSEAATSICQTNDNGFIVGGYSEFDNGIVYKLDSIGNVQWEKTYGVSLHTIINTNDGGYFIYGNDNSDFYGIKTDNNGNLIWQKYYGGSNSEQPTSVISTYDGGFLMVGDTDSNDGDVSGNHGGQDFWAVKIDSAGNIIWTKCYGGDNGDNAYSVTQTNDGNYFLAGVSSSSNGNVTTNHGFYDYWIIKIDATGNLIWEKSVGGSEADHPYAIFETNDGGCIVSGETESINGDVIGCSGSRDYWIVKFSNTLDIKESVKETITFYPNPVKNNLTIVSNSNTKQNVEIFNIIGEKLTCIDIFDKATINISNFTKGVYILKVNNDNNIMVSKFIKE